MTWYKKAFELIKNMFIGLSNACTRSILGESLVSNSEELIKCVFINNRPCQARPKFVDINCDECIFYPFNDNVDKCGESCNAFDDPYARVCVPDKVKKYKRKVI